MSFYQLPPTKFKDFPIKPKADYIEFINVEDWTYEQWLEYREYGLGGSEIAAVCAAYSDYLRAFIHTDPIKIHCLKIGEPVLEFQGNRFSRFGQFHERNLLFLYQYWDHANPGEDAMFDNMEKGIIKNEVYGPKMYVKNSKYPHLFYSPDGLNLSHRGTINLEFKNTSTMEARNYTNYVNPSFRCQVQHGLAISEHDSASIFIHLDGNNVMEVYEPHNPELQQWQLECSIKFFNNMTECIKIKQEYGIDSYYYQPTESFTDRQKEGLKELMEREPTLTGNESEESFIKELFHHREESIIREMTQEEHEWAMERKSFLNKAKEVEREIRLINAKIERGMLESDVNKIVGDLETGVPWISFKQDKGKSKPTLRVSSDYQADKLQDSY